jgi:hypothetical protein
VIAHYDHARETVIIDAIREYRPRFVPANVIAELAQLLRNYRISEVWGDRAFHGFHSDEWLRNDRVFRPSPRTTSESYLKALPRMLAGRVRLLDHPGGRSQFAMLERKPMAGGDHVDHPRSASAHDDVACAIAGAMCQVMDAVREDDVVRGTVTFFDADGRETVMFGPPANNAQEQRPIPADCMPYVRRPEPWDPYVRNGVGFWSGLPGHVRDRRDFQMSEQSDVEKAKEVIAGLEAKREACIKHGTELADERANVALAAHTGDQKAKKRLDDIHQKIVVHVSELASLDAALRAAGEKLTAAERAVDAAAEREKASRRKTAIADLREVAPAFDEVLEDLIKITQAVALGVRELRAAGGSLSEGQLFMMHRCITTALRETPFARAYEHIPPNERKLPSAMIKAWMDNEERQVDATLRALDLQQEKAA